MFLNLYKYKKILGKKTRPGYKTGGSKNRMDILLLSYSIVAYVKRKQLSKKANIQCASITMLYVLWLVAYILPSSFLFYSISSILMITSREKNLHFYELTKSKF